MNSSQSSRVSLSRACPQVCTTHARSTNGTFSDNEALVTATALFCSASLSSILERPALLLRLEPTLLTSNFSYGVRPHPSRPQGSDVNVVWKRLGGPSPEPPAGGSGHQWWPLWWLASDGTGKESELGNRRSYCMKGEGVLPEESSKSPHPPDPCWPYFIICSGIRPSAWESVEGTLPAQQPPDFPIPWICPLPSKINHLPLCEHCLTDSIRDVASEQIKGCSLSLLKVMGEGPSSVPR